MDPKEKFQEQMRILMEKNQSLLDRIKEAVPLLQNIKRAADREFGAPDLFYRFYYQSFKVYRIQNLTVEMRALFEQLADGGKLNSWYLQIVEEGTGKDFDLSHNSEWLKHTRPMMEAYFHSMMFVEQMLWCAENMEKAESLLPSPWAAVLTLFEMR